MKACANRHCIGKTDSGYCKVCAEIREESFRKGREAYETYQTQVYERRLREDCGLDLPRSSG
jgi:hypothetical protein